MQRINLVLLLSVSIASAATIASDNKNEISNEVIAVDESRTINFDSVTSSIINEQALQRPFSKSRSIKSNESKRSGQIEARKKIKKLKKLLFPIIIFLIAKAVILIPLALGILAFKTWNAIQLSFVSFVTAAALAFWKFCTKVNHEHPALVHGGWELDRTDPQLLAYSGYASDSRIY